MTVDRDTDRAYFESIPWCLELLQDPGFTPTPTFSRQYKESTEDALFAETLKTSDTIRACSSLYKRPDPSGIGQISELIMLVSLGYRVNGHPNLCHGGIVGTLVDEAMGMLLTVNKNLTSSPPQTILITTRLREIKGRKIYLEASVKDGCDVNLAKAEALWIRSMSPKRNYNVFATVH